MNVKWPNLVGFALTLLAVVLIVCFHREMGTALESIAAIGPGHTLDEQTLGLGVLGVILAALVGVVRIACRNSGKDEK